MMKCVIIEDEPLAARIISGHIAKTAGLELVKTFENAFEALYYIQTRPVDLVFLDIQMPGINGVQFIKILKYRPPIIVTTAYREYALAALEVGVADYLLKPIDYERFLQAVSKVFDRETRSVSPHNELPSSTDQPGLGIAYIKTENAYVQIRFADILYLQGQKSYTYIITAQKRYTVSGNLAVYTQKLSAPQFIRIHKSYLVARDKIGKFNSTHVWIEDTAIPIGRTYRQAFMRHMEPLRW